MRSMTPQFPKENAPTQAGRLLPGRTRKRSPGLLSGCVQGVRRISPATSETTNSTRKMKNRIFAMSTDTPAIAQKPGGFGSRRDPPGVQEAIRLNLERSRELDPVGELRAPVDADHQATCPRRQADRLGHANERAPRGQHLGRTAGAPPRLSQQSLPEPDLQVTDHHDVDDLAIRPEIARTARSRSRGPPRAQLISRPCSQHRGQFHGRMRRFTKSPSFARCPSRSLILETACFRAREAVNLAEPRLQSDRWHERRGGGSCDCDASLMWLSAA